MYKYEDLKNKLFTDESQRTFLKIRDFINKNIEKSGAIRMKEIMSCGSGDSWTLMACVDRLVELNEILEIQQTTYVPGQYRIFIKPY